MDPYHPNSVVNMADLVVALRDLPKDYHPAGDIHAAYSKAATEAGRTPASLSSVDKLLLWMGCEGLRGRGRWINVESLAKSWPREAWRTPESDDSDDEFI